MKVIILVFALGLTAPAQASWLNSLKQQMGTFWTGLKQTLGIDGQIFRSPILPPESALKGKHSPDESKRRWKARSFSREEQTGSDRTFLLEIFQAVRPSPPSQQQLNRWMSVIEQGGSREGIYRSMVLDRFYADLETGKHPISPDALKFATTFHTRFLIGEWKGEEWSTGNFYHLKRTTVERALEVFDAFGLEREEDMYRWYAIVAAHLAEHYPKAFESEQRRETLRENHFSWAKQMPWQRAKSELIIRLHKVYNSLSLPSR